MSAHVVVISTTLQRVRVNVDPGTHMTDILAEACKTLGPRYSDYGFKHNNKSLDMSRRFRETNLASGAKLELVAMSRSPVPVQIALQVGEERLRDTFPSNTSLWQILRRFESKDKMKYNFTENSCINDIESGSGQLFYEQPIVNILGKDVSALAELQKSLAQFGVNGGTVLIRLTFRKTERAFADAVAEIDDYFKDKSFSETLEPTTQPVISAANDTNTDPEVSSAEPEREVKGGDSTVSDAAGGSSEDNAHHASSRRGIVPPKIFQAMAESEETSLKQKQAAQSNLMHIEKVHEARTGISSSQNAAAAVQFDENLITPATLPTPVPIEQINTVFGPNGRPILITKAPSGDTPAAAKAPFDEMDYEPSQAHAVSVISRLQTEAQNKRLPSDAEMERTEKEKLAKVAATEISLRVRFPDQTTLTSKFNAQDTAGGLYTFVRGVIIAENQPFVLNIYGLGDIPRDETKKLIKDLKISTNTQVTFRWGDNASESARKPPALKEEYANKAVDIPLLGPMASGTDREPGQFSTKDDGKKKEVGGKGKGLGAFKKFLPGGRK